MFKRYFSFAIVILFLASCGQNSSTFRGIEGNGTVQLSMSGLEPMLNQHYEGWVITSAGPLSTGRFSVSLAQEVFSVDANGSILSIIGTNGQASFNYTPNEETITGFVLTIEPNGDADPAPSESKYLAGTFNIETRAAAALTSDGAAIGESFLTSSGTYILATPSNGQMNPQNGIWFLQSGNASLNIPDLTGKGWAYEGWVVQNGNPPTPISTGVFFKPSGADIANPAGVGAGAGLNAGPNPSPPFPGEDFISPTSRTLNDGTYTTVISVEPFPDRDPAPFTLKILQDFIDLNQVPMVSVPLQNFSNESVISIQAVLL